MDEYQKVINDLRIAGMDAMQEAQRSDDKRFAFYGQVMLSAAERIAAAERDTEDDGK